MTRTRLVKVYIVDSSNEAEVEDDNEYEEEKEDNEVEFCNICEYR